MLAYFGVVVVTALVVDHYSSDQDQVLSKNFANSAKSDGEMLTTCPFSKGDSVKRVKEVCGIASEPQRLKTVTPGGTAYQYHFERYGLWVFFDESLLIKSLRYDTPFQGKVGGVGLGDTSDRVRSMKGSPALYQFHRHAGSQDDPRRRSREFRDSQGLRSRNTRFCPV